MRNPIEVKMTVLTEYANKQKLTEGAIELEALS